jgi:hypothetical protein
MIEKYKGNLVDFGLNYVDSYSQVDNRGSFQKIFSPNTELFSSMADVQ